MPNISDIILKGRFIFIFILIASITVMSEFAKDAKLTYQMAKILPEDNQIFIENEKFKEEFGESINTMVIAVQDVEFFSKEHLHAWNKFGKKIQAIEGVNDVLNITDLPILTIDSTKKHFNSENWYHPELSHQDLDASIKILDDQKIYEGLLYNKEVYSAIMLVDIDKVILDKKE